MAQSRTINDTPCQLILVTVDELMYLRHHSKYILLINDDSHIERDRYILSRELSWPGKFKVFLKTREGEVFMQVYLLGCDKSELSRIHKALMLRWNQLDEIGWRLHKVHNEITRRKSDISRSNIAIQVTLFFNSRTADALRTPTTMTHQTGRGPNHAT